MVSTGHRAGPGPALGWVAADDSDGPAILGRTRYDNLFLDCGHGSNGWTQACGTGKIVADIVAGRPPEVDMEGLTAERYAS